MNSPRLGLAPSLILVILLAATVAIAARPEPVVTRTPQKSSYGDRTPTLWWIFAGRDLATCKSPAYTFRHLRTELGGRLDIVAYSLDVDEQDARSYLRSERLDVELVRPSRQLLPGSLRNAPAPGIYLTMGDSVLRAFPSGTTHVYPDLAALRAALERYLPRPTSTAEAPVPPPNQRPSWNPASDAV